MIEILRQRKTLIIVALLTLAGLFGLGYLFASKKSEPVYRSKIDQIMYDMHNKSPKYVITLPDKTKAQKKSDNDIQNTEEATPPEEAKKPEEDPHSLAAILSKMPNLGMLGDADGQRPLAQIQAAPDLIEEKDGLKLPKINGKDKPWEYYGNKVSVMPRFNRIAVIIENIGINPMNFELINKGLPAEVSFSFSPYAPEVDKQILAARTEGHESYMDFLLPSKDYLKTDTGPMSMSLTASLEENRNRLEKVIGINAPVGGLIINPGVADESNAEQLSALLQEIKNRGLLIVDSTNENGIDSLKTDKPVRAKADIIIDDDFTPQAIEQQLQQAEQIAREKGQVIIIAKPKPVAILALSKWIKTFSPQLSYEEVKLQNITEIERPFAIIPISNLVVE